MLHRATITWLWIDDRHLLCKTGIFSVRGEQKRIAPDVFDTPLWWKVVSISFLLRYLASEGVLELRRPQIAFLKAEPRAARAGIIPLPVRIV